MDYYSAAMTNIAAIDGTRNGYNNMLYHSSNALRYNSGNPIASVYAAIAEIHLGSTDSAVDIIESILNTDPLNHLARYVYLKLGRLCSAMFYGALKSDMSQTCLDVSFNLKACGEAEWANDILSGVANKSPIIYYILGDYETAEGIKLNSSFPFRTEEYKLLKSITDTCPMLPMAQYYLGCLEYANGKYKCAAEHFEKAIRLKPDFYAPYRNLAVAFYSHLNHREEVLPLLKKALFLNPKNSQLLYETAYAAAKLGVAPIDRIAFIKENTGNSMRDDTCLELARAYNQNGSFDEAVKLLDSHVFVPCEGGEHAVAEQYMFAYHAVGRRLLSDGKYAEAAEGRGQIWVK